ncbi:SDR family NAD(P)-dependent oxidoreductase [Micromonospora sp. NBC_01813]|uniref:SDR family NAD(P)-dependent oxidoreductase n=1 Tax=Micromonospora sp. NBC_01813 TaxID=2975988 RepID=UPI002DDB190E|nr:SDR family NAD(P)-dependent oxidoreductase [Micromonospora sp. NBC_01813]WSA08679.1 SDR family NAD(P)-dependent oxidoreductase [Micromonospora sp. NBC_01813]
MTESTKRALVTGGTGGIGLATAHALASHGYAVTIVGRDQRRGDAARDQLAAAAAARSAATGTAAATARFIRADLSSLHAVNALADDIRASGPLDLLVNNVGGGHRQHTHTADGIEATFAINHLSGYLLTELLVDDMISAGHGRIVTLTSGAIRLADRTPLDRVEMAGRYYGFSAYGRAKLANLAYTMGLADRLRGTGVAVLAADPGASATDMGRSMRADLFPMPARLAFPLIYLNLFRSSPADAARSSIAAATGDFPTGTVLGPKGTPVTPDARATDPTVIQAVTALSQATCASALTTSRPD